MLEVLWEKKGWCSEELTLMEKVSTFSEQRANLRFTYRKRVLSLVFSKNIKGFLLLSSVVYTLKVSVVQYIIDRG